MSAIQEHPPEVLTEQRPWYRVRELWAGASIVAIWLAVLFVALFAPDLMTTSAAADSARIPSVVLVAPFAALATWAVARHGLGRRGG
jgi:protein-S-isoprenylcysteine O-methyltransferase Ste14